MGSPRNGGTPAHDGGTPRPAPPGATSTAQGVTLGSPAVSAAASPSQEADAGGYTVVRNRRGRKKATQGSSRAVAPSRPHASTPTSPPPRAPVSAEKTASRPKYSPLDRSIFQLVECLRKAASPRATVAVLGRVQRLLRTAEMESEASFDKEYNADSLTDCVALHELLKQWLLRDRIRLADFKQRFRSFRVLHAEPTAVKPTMDGWRQALLSDVPRLSSDAPDSSDMEVDLAEPPAVQQSVVCSAIGDALEHRLVRGTLVAQLEGNMRLHQDSSFQAKLRQLTDINPEVAAAHQELKRCLVNAAYDPGSNRVIFSTRTRAEADRWAGTLISIQGRLIQLRRPSSPGHSTPDSIDLGVYKLRAYNLGGTLNKLDIWHLFHGLLGLRVDHLAVACPANPADADPQLWDVHVRYDGCPSALRGKTKVEWEGETVWLHHTAFSPSPPCTRCASPTHPRRLCRGEFAREELVLRVSGPRLPVPDSHDAVSPPSSLQLAELARQEEQRLVETSLMAGEDRPAPPQETPRAPSPIVYSTPTAVVRRKRFDVLRQRCFELALPERLRLWRVLADSDPTWLSEQETFRLPAPEPQVELTFLQLLRKISLWRPPSEPGTMQPFTSSLARALRTTAVGALQPSAHAAGPTTDSVVYELCSYTDSDDDGDSSVHTDSMSVEMDGESVEDGEPSGDDGADVRCDTNGPPPSSSGADSTGAGAAAELAERPAAPCAAASRGTTSVSNSVGQVGKARTTQSSGSTPRRASRNAIKYAATNLGASHLLRENPFTGEIEPAPAKITQLTVSKFFAPRAGAQARRRVPAPLPPRLPSAPPVWTSIKTQMTASEIVTPANGSCYYFAIGAAKINVCPDQFTCSDRKMRREGSYYRREINLAILARLPDLLATGTFDTAQLCRRFLPAGHPDSELADQMERHYRTAAKVSCVEVCSAEYWAHEEELLGTAFWFGEPIFVFEVCPDDRVLLQVFRGDNGKRGARGEYWPIERGVQVVRELLAARVLPLLLAYYPGGSTSQPAGHFNVLRLPLQRYLEWAGTAGRRARMAKRRAATLSKLGMLPSPSDEPEPEPLPSADTADSEYQPSTDALSSGTSTGDSVAECPDLTPQFPASPVTPSSPLASQDVPTLLQRFRKKKTVPESLELPLAKVRHANKVAYLRWRDSAARTSAAVGAALRAVATPDAACVNLQEWPAEATTMLQSLPHGLVLLSQLDEATWLNISRALVCEVRLCSLQAYAERGDTPRRRAASVSAWVTAGAALSRLDARWNMLHDDGRWRRLLPASFRAHRSPAGLSDSAFCRLLMVLLVTLPEADAGEMLLAPVQQATRLIAWLSAPSRVDIVTEVAAALDQREWLAIASLHDALRREPLDSSSSASSAAPEPSSRC